MAMDYLSAEAILADAAQQALSSADYDLFSRVLLPLQEARRQRRQRCGEGTVCLDLISHGPDAPLDAEKIVDAFPSGQLLVAGWGSIQPALEIGRLQRERGLYLDTFLAAAYPTDAGRAVVIAPLPDTALPAPAPRTWDALAAALSPRCLLLRAADLPSGQQKGTTQTYGRIMDLWEQLHSPFLVQADAADDLQSKIPLYELTISVDYACELAHQRLAQTARRLLQMLK